MHSSAGQPLTGDASQLCGCARWRMSRVLRAAGLLDYGQAKQLANAQRLAFARLVVALSAAANAPLLGVLDALSPSQQARRGRPLSPSSAAPRRRFACGAASVPHSAALHAPWCVRCVAGQSPLFFTDRWRIACCGPLLLRLTLVQSSLYVFRM